MAPKPRIINAFRSMKELGINKDVVKPVLKGLLKLYNGKMDLIEEENYRILADAILEYENSKAADQKKPNADVQTEADDLGEETQVHDEPERLMKRLRLRHQEQLVSSSPNESNAVLAGAPLKVPKLEADEHPEIFSQKVPVPGPVHVPLAPVAVLPSTQLRARENQPASPKPISLHERSEPSQQQGIIRGMDNETRPSLSSPRDKGKGPLSPHIPSRDLRSYPRSLSQTIRLREPHVEPGISLSPKVKVPNTFALIKPKDEPVTDDVSEFGVPLAITFPDAMPPTDSADRNTFAERPVSQYVNGKSKEDGASATGKEKLLDPVHSKDAKVDKEYNTIPTPLKALISAEVVAPEVLKIPRFRGKTKVVHRTRKRRNKGVPDFDGADEPLVHDVKGPVFDFTTMREKAPIYIPNWSVATTDSVFDRPDIAREVMEQAILPKIMRFLSSMPNEADSAFDRPHFAREVVDKMILPEDRRYLSTFSNEIHAAKGMEHVYKAVAHFSTGMKRLEDLSNNAQELIAECENLMTRVEVLQKELEDSFAREQARGEKDQAEIHRQRAEIERLKIMIGTPEAPGEVVRAAVEAAEDAMIEKLAAINEKLIQDSFNQCKSRVLELYPTWDLSSLQYDENWVPTPHADAEGGDNEDEESSVDSSSEDGSDDDTNPPRV